LAVDLGRVVAHDAVEQSSRAAGLDDVDLGAGANVEALPVQDGSVGGLLDVHLRATAGDLHLTGGHLVARGQGAGVQGPSAVQPTKQDGCGQHGRAYTFTTGALALCASVFAHGDQGAQALAEDDFVEVAIHVSAKQKCYAEILLIFINLTYQNVTFWLFVASF
jgi:hypothetical protein